MAIEVNRTRDVAFSDKVKAYFELTKPRIAFMLVLTAAAGFYLGSGQFDLSLFVVSMLGITFLAFGTATLNQFVERESDRLMKRTASRPLPSGRLTAREALIFGIILCILAELILFSFVNFLTGILGILVILGYVLLYTPLKKVTTFSTVIGAFPGAMPPLMGWTAAANEISIHAWILFSIIFFWQFPHFLAIAWMYRDEYEKAGIKMLPVIDKQGKVTILQVLAFTVLLLVTSVVPFFVGMVGSLYLTVSMLLGAYFLYSAIQMARKRTIASARQVLIASVVYLPIVFALIVLDS